MMNSMSSLLNAGISNLLQPGHPAGVNPPNLNKLPDNSQQYNAPEGDRSLHLSPLLNLPYKAVNDVWSIYGMRGSGKSYFLGRMVEELNRIRVPFVIIDVLNAHALIELPNCIHARMNEVQPTSVVPRLGGGESMIVSMRGANLDDIRVWVTELFNSLSRVDFGQKYGHPCMVCIEECQNFIGQGASSASGDKQIRGQCLATVDKLFRESRQAGIGIVLISQSIATVLPDARRQAAIKVIFGVKDSTDIDALKKSLIGKTHRGVDQIIDRVFNFTPGQFVCVAPAYISGQGTIIDKTSERTTKHAGRSFVENGAENPESSLTGSDPVFDPMAMTATPMTAMAASDADYTPDEAKPEADLYTAPSAASKKIDYKSALCVALLAISVVGIGAVVLKKYISIRDEDKEKSIEEKLKAERMKIDALRQQASTQPKTQEVGQPAILDTPDKDIAAGKYPGEISSDDPFLDMPA